MKLIIDIKRKLLIKEFGRKKQILGLYTKEAFHIISEQWLKVGWDLKYTYAFSWMGRPIIQLPEDMIRIQEVIYRVRPDVIVETGVAHGGSLIYYASLCKLMGKGRVIGIDIEIRLHNRKAIQAHELSSYITLIEGDSVAQKTIKRVRSLLKPNDTVLVILDSCHSKKHVLRELEAYHRFVTRGSYIVVTDGIMKELNDVPHGNPEWVKDNPQEAVYGFQSKHPEFILEQPKWVFNESNLTQNITYWPNAWFRKK